MNPSTNQHSLADKKTDLSALSLKVSYRSGESDLLNDFYIPCLRQSMVYKRAVGFFTSAGLAEAARGIAELIRNGGKMFLIASPKMNPEDVQKIRAGYDKREIITKSLERALDEPLDNEADIIRVRNLTWLIANNKLDVRIARPTAWQGQGIYHEKLGLFFDSLNENGNAVAFTGSINETSDSLVRNYESVDVSVSWENSEREQRRVRGHIEHFAKMWNGIEAGLETIEFPEAVRRRLVRTFRPSDDPSSEPGKRRTPFPFQLEAITAWKEASFKGILAMATGSGKTFTALKCLEKCPKRILSIIVVPLQDLIDQWENEIRVEYADRCVIRKVSSANGDWPSELKRIISAFNSGAVDPEQRIFVLATIQSASGDTFRRIVSGIKPKQLALVIDEVHHSGAKEFSKVLGISADYRLGLSATPERSWDDEGNQRIFDYFGPEVYDYAIANAIADGNLTEYRYYLHPTSLTRYEQQEFRALSRRIQVSISGARKRYSALSSKSVPQVIQYLDQVGDKTGYQLRNLYLKRVALLKKAANKIGTLRMILKQYKLRRCIVYCNDLDHLDECRKAIFDEGLDPVEYSSRVSSATRTRIRKDFEGGEGPDRVLVAVRCLDEGIDIPVCDSAVLVASSKSTREFIQRRGRVLRKHPSKTISEIHDILVLPFITSDEAYPLTDSEFETVESELHRAEEFARNAENGYEILKYLSDLQTLAKSAHMNKLIRQ